MSNVLQRNLIFIILIYDVKKLINSVNCIYYDILIFKVCDTHNISWHFEYQPDIQNVMLWLIIIAHYERILIAHVLW